MDQKLKTMEKNKILNFTDLNAWKEGHKIVVRIYKITDNFPKAEIFGLTNQMRRCAVSITSNIAEGFSRQSYKEKVFFYSTALGSITELQNQILIARDVGYLDNKIFDVVSKQTVVVHKITNGLIKMSKSKFHNS